jgi:ADP-ribose pyrophosphatase YjhB (NUDIX family)
MGEIITIYAGEQPPESWDACLLLGGSAPGGSSAATPWQPEVIALLRERWTGSGRLVVFVPELRSGARNDPDAELTDWYDHALDIADVVLFWWLDDTDPRLVSTSLAAWNDSQRMVHGTPSHAPQSRYLVKYADGHAMSTAATLDGMVSTVLDKIGFGAPRTAGERDVPLPVWRTDSFQRWYSAQTSAGNILLGARQVWTFSTEPRKRLLLYWALHVRVYVRAEGRIKSNEVVISRPDISVVALYHRGSTIDDTTIVLVREFRSPASTPDGLVHELPGGSGIAKEDVLDQAVRETEEETGFAIDVQRIRAHGSRQLAATLSAHHAHLFAAEITGVELARLRTIQSTPHGAGDSELTWVEITTFSEIRENRLVDWATLGMIAEAVLDRSPLPPRAKR